MPGNKAQDAPAPAADRPRCGAHKKGPGGGICTQTAGWGTKHPGSGRCKLHGGASTGPQTDAGKAKVAANAVKHGAYMEKLLDDAERDIYDALYDQTVVTYKLDLGNTMHMATLHRACMSYIKTLRLDEWEMEEVWEPHKIKNNKNGSIMMKGGKPVLVGKPVYNRDGEYVGEELGTLRRIRWATNAPNWETHFQKYMAVLGTSRADELKAKQDAKTSGKVVQALNWLWGGKSEQTGEG